MSDFNLNLQQFIEISNGSKNAGQVDVVEDGHNGFKLKKINHHVHFTGLNNKSLSPEKIVGIKESFIKALEGANLDQNAINLIKKDLGLTDDINNTLDQNKEMYKRRFTPLTRQEIKDYISLARGENPADNPNLNVQKNVLNGLPKGHDKTAFKVFKAMSFLSGVKITNIPEFNENGLKFFAEQPKGLNEFYKKINELLRKHAENPNAQDLQVSTTVFHTNPKGLLTLKINRNEDNMPILAGILNIDGYEIPLNFGVSPEEYLKTINQNLLDFMDVLPDVKDKNNLSLGRNYLIKNLDTLKKDLLSQNELNGTQPNQLRSLAMEILKKDNVELPQDVERLSTEIIVNFASTRLKTNVDTANLNRMLTIAVNEMQDMANYLVPGQVHQEEPQAQGMNEENNIQPQNDINNVNVNNNNVNNNNVNNIPQQVNDNVIVEYAVEDPDGEYELYDLPEFNDNKTLTSFANKLFELGNPANNPFDFNAFKTLLIENFDVFVAFGTEAIQLGSYEEVDGDKTVTIEPKFTNDQLLAIFDRMCQDAKTKTHTEMEGGNAVKVPTENLKKFLQYEASPQTLEITIKRLQQNVKAQLDKAQNPNAPKAGVAKWLQGAINNNPVPNENVNVNNVQNNEQINNNNEPKNNDEKEEVVNINAVDANNDDNVKVEDINEINEINEVEEEEIQKDPLLAEAIRVNDSEIRNMLNIVMELPDVGDKDFKIRKLYDVMNEKDFFKSLVCGAEDKEALKKALPPKLQPLVDDIQAMLKGILSELIDIMQDGWYKKYDIDTLTVSQFNTLNKYFSNISITFDQGKNIYSKILDIFSKTAINSPLVENAAQNFQNFINEIFKLDGDLKIDDSYDKMSAQEIKNSLANKNVDEILQDAKTGKNQPGKTAFNLLVLKNYFIQLPKIEIIRIMGEVVKSEPSDPDKKELEIAPNKRLFSAILKGCGPLMQKMLQGMSKDLADKSYGDVFDELKSNLKHIDHEYAEKTVESYTKNKKHHHITVSVEKSLGSASVAETFQCKAYITTFYEGGGHSKKEEVYVIKVKRPNIQERAENEAKIFNEAAKQIPGMSESWNNQLQSIMKEFDFVNEAQNIDDCRKVFEVHENYKSKDKDIAPNVKSLSRDTMVPVTNDVIMTKLIPGDTVDKVYSNLQGEIDEEFKQVFKINSETGTWELDKNGNPIIREDVNPMDIVIARRRLPQYINKIFSFNGLVKQATAKWLKEVIFNSGIIHNDVHGGNLMITQDGTGDYITFIDYGNVVKISKEAQAQFKDLLSYTMHRDSQKFTDTLLSMLPNKPTEEQKAKMTAIVEAIMQKGHSTDDAGYRLSAIFAELRKLGITFSAELEGISNGLNRLQAFADNTNKLLKETRKLYELLIGNQQHTPYKNSQFELENGYEGGIFNELIDYLLSNNAKNDDAREKIQDVKDKLKDPESEIRVKLPFKILKDAFEGDFSYTEKFTKTYVEEKQYTSWEELKAKKYDENLTKLKNSVKEAKDARISMQQIQSIMETKTVPPELKAHEKLINELVTQLSAFTENVVFLLEQRADKPRYYVREFDDMTVIQPTVDKDGKVINDPFETNNLSVEGVLGNILTMVNNFTMTQVKPPVIGEIANQTNQKPMVEVSNNPLGHVKTEGNKIAS